MRLSLLPPILILGLAACDSEVGEDDPLADVIDDEAKTDSLSSPTNHHDYFFGTRMNATISGSARYHAWEFQLTGPGQIHLEAFNPDFQSPTSTVLYLYVKSSGSTWKKVTSVATDGTSDPALDQALASGSYRVIVKGKTKTTSELAALWGRCEGAGCAPVPGGCLFGRAGLSRLPDSYVTVTDDPAQTIQVTSLLDPTSVTLREVVSAWIDATGWQPATESDVPDMTVVLADIQNGTVTRQTATASTGEAYDLLGFQLASGKKVSGFFLVVDSEARAMGAIMLGSTMKRCYAPAPVCRFGDALSDVSQQFDLGPESLVEESGRTLHVVDLTAHDDGHRYTMITYDHDGATQGLIYEADSTQVAASISAGRIERCQPTREPWADL